MMEHIAKEAREVHWQQIEGQCQQITDGLDEPIDTAILPLVVALNALGLPTTGSCAGHLDHGTYAPYVDFEAHIELTDRLAVMHALEQASHLIQNAQSPAEQEVSDQRYQEVVRMQQRIYAPSLALRARLSEYLTRYYAAVGPRSFNQRLVIQGLVIQGIGTEFRLESQGAGLQSLADHEQKSINLQAYQAEMSSFAAFLRALYFSYA